MSDKIRFNLNLILITDITAFHLSLAELRTAFTLLRNVLFHMVWFTTKLYASSFMSRLSTLFLSTFPAKTLALVSQVVLRTVI